MPPPIRFSALLMATALLPALAGCSGMAARETAARHALDPDYRGPSLQQVDLAHLDDDMTGPRTRVLVLGSVHLAQGTGDFGHAALEPLLDRLAAFQPDIITVESLPGEECDRIALYPHLYDPGMMSRFCGDTTLARAATGLDVPAAIAERDRLLGNWPERPTPADRRRLASVFLAANEEESALAQWLQLPADERRAGDGLGEALAGRLEELETHRSEGFQIGARLAARLGLPRVHPVDNHTGDALRIEDVEAFGKEIQAAWGSDRSGLEREQERQDALSRLPDLLPLYRSVNDPDYLQALANVNVHSALAAESDTGYPRMWVAGWEIRNLRMVANIHETFRERPGARVLTIVGASHKPWFDHLLDQMQGVDVVDAETVLGPNPPD